VKFDKWNNFGFLFFLIVGSVHVYAQENQTHYLVELNTIQATKSTVPFWLSANSYGRIQQQPSTLVYSTIYNETSNLNCLLRIKHRKFMFKTNALWVKKKNVKIEELFVVVKIF